MAATTNGSHPARARTGVPGLDSILHGGLIPSRIYLVEGSPGAGKTTLALQYLREGIAAGERCLYISLSETREELIAGAESHGMSLDGIEILELIASESELDGDNHLTMYHPSEIELTETTRKVLDVVERTNPRRIVFDSLSELRLLAQSSLRYRRQILALKQFFVGRHCTVVLLDDQTAEGPDLQLHSIAHGVIALEHRAPAYGRAQRQMRVVKFRGSDFRGGYHDMTIRRGGLTVYPRLSAAEHGRPFEQAPIQSGVTELDKLLGGGIDRGTSTLLTGPPGSGKSTIAVRYAIAAVERGEHAALFDFDETKPTLTARMSGLGYRFKEGIGPGKLNVRQIDPTELSPGEFAHLVRHSVEHDGARVIVIDSLNGYLNSMPEDRFLTAQLHELLSYLNNQGVVTLMVVAMIGTMGPNMRSPVDTSYLADSVISLRYFEHAGRVKKAISVMKKRSGAHEESIRELKFSGDGIHLSEPLLQLRGVLTGVPTEVETTGPSSSGTTTR